MMGNKAKKVVIEDGRIFIPGTSVSQADQDSVMAILGQYKRSLYKIQTYKDGNPSGKPHGALPDRSWVNSITQVASNAKQNALSGWGIQIGSATSSHPTQPGPNLSPVAVHRTLLPCHRLFRVAIRRILRRWRLHLILNVHEMRTRRHRAKWLPSSLQSCAV